MEHDTRKFVLFDFDGVIANSFQVSFAAHKFLCPHTTEEEYLQGFEGNIIDWVRRENVHTPECRRDIDFFDHYLPKMLTEVLPVSGMDAVIRTLQQDYTLVIISSSRGAVISEFLKAHGLAESFVSILGNEVHRSKVEKTRRVFAEYGARAKDCLFVTDTLGDIREAAEAGVSSVAVSWGFHPEETLHLGKPFRIAESPEELPRIVEAYFSA